MNFYYVTTDEGKRKKFAVGGLKEVYRYERTICPTCKGQCVTPDYYQLFNYKTWNLKMYMSRDHYADFMSTEYLQLIISEKAKKVLTENFGDAVDFGDIEMVSHRDLSAEKLKEIRDAQGYAYAKKIPNDPPQFYRLFLKRDAAIDFEKSGYKLVVDCPTCGYKFYEQPIFEYSVELGKITYTPTVYIIESTWKGCDIFRAEGEGLAIFCTDKFKEAYDQHKLTGLIFSSDYLKVETV